MVKDEVLARYLEALLHGDRGSCRSIIEETMQRGVPANSVYLHLIWPVMSEIERLSRGDRITSVQEHLATRINRTIVDQLQNKLPRRPAKHKKVAVCCSREELQELGAQMIADLFESDGWQVRFLGGGLSNDDIFEYINEYAPDVLLVYGTTPKQAPDIRRLIDRVRSVNAWPDMRIVVSGGLFNRAEGLWEEIGADGFAATAAEVLQVAADEQPVPGADRRTVNRRKRRQQTAVQEVVHAE
ncbi:MAG TPA: cobalamin-dependent protein [Sedimentisphaerales bacterium]|jgi:methanogenic corrinoid protein MtbC1|nr:cobalamin-dependent protein [Sedimentisphaerales bacterium]HNU29349.1 cobalamin-dependent protein [Sedimentisphaerales bacterium]